MRADKEERERWIESSVWKLSVLQHTTQLEATEAHVALLKLLESPSDLLGH